MNNTAELIQCRFMRLEKGLCLVTKAFFDKSVIPMSVEDKGNQLKILGGSYLQGILYKSRIPSKQILVTYQTTGFASIFTMAPPKKSQMPVSGQAPRGDSEKTYSAKVLSDVEECSEPSSPTLPGSMGDIYKIRLGQAIKELQGLIQQIRMHEIDISEVAESLARFAEKQNILLQTAGDDAFLAKCGSVTECFCRELMKLMVRIKALSHILSLNADRPHVEIVPVMLERVRLDMIDLKLVRFLNTKKTGREICATSTGNEAL